MGRFLVRILAVVGALAIVLAVGLGVTLWRTSRPAGTSGSAGGAATTRRDAGKVTTARSLTADVTVPFPVVEAQMAAGTTLKRASDDEVAMTSRVEGAGRQWDVTATGRVTADGRDIVIDPTNIDTPGPDAVDAIVTEFARSALSLRRSVPGLPENVRMSGLKVTDSGFDVHLDGTDVPLPEPVAAS